MWGGFYLTAIDAKDAKEGEEESLLGLSCQYLLAAMAE
jgi:hypothetical protein